MNFVNFNSQKSPSPLDEGQHAIARDKIDEQRNLPAASSERSIEQLASNLLKYGVLLASLIVIISGIRYFVLYWSEIADFRFFRGEPSEFCSPVGVIKAVLSGNPLGSIQFGLLLLIATPVARVAFSLLTFIWQRDLIYALLTLFVLIGLIYGFLGAYV